MAMVEIERAGSLTSDGLRILHQARRRAGKGVRGAGPKADRRRAELLALVVEADEALNEARILLDRVLVEAALVNVRAPRPVIVLPA
ncbi:MAG: hypothetical protein JWO68_895 [Actinomycetia bacterium]|nr:hypothetical protein [Actinomycetes bacterium]